MSNVLVIGDLILDEYIYVRPLKISDEAHVITSLIQGKKISLGGAGNVACNIASQGNQCTFVGLSSFKYKKEITSNFKKFNIKCKLFIVDDSIQIKTRVVSNKKQQISRYDSQIEPKVSKLIIDNVISFIKNNIASYDFIVISKYYDFFIKERLVSSIIKLAHQYKKKLIVDNRQNNYQIFDNIDFYKLNFKEFCNIYGQVDNTFESIKKTINKNNLIKSNLLITRSELSTIFVSKDRKDIFEINVEKVEVNDVSGAGDTFVATFASFFQEKKDIKELIKFCHSMCNIVVKKQGTNVVWTYEFSNNVSLKIISNQLKLNNKKIVFTNGVFDILHEGHIKLLQEAKVQGDYLIVGLNSDSSVKKLKGDDRPIKNEDERKLILEATKYVDKVIIFNELTVDNCLKQIKPDVYVKGGDYKIENLPEKKSLKYVEKVVFVDLVKNKSTTNIVKKIKSR